MSGTSIIAQISMPLRVKWSTVSRFEWPTATNLNHLKWVIASDNDSSFQPDHGSTRT